MNILEQSEALKNIPEQALVQEMQMPTGMAPQYLILTEIQRRKRIRDEFQRREAQDIPTVAEETVQAAGMPQAGVMQLAKNMAPQTSMGQNTGVANAAPRQPTMGMAEGGITRLREGGKVFRMGGAEFALFDDGEVYRISPNGRRFKAPASLAKAVKEFAAQAELPQEPAQAEDILAQVTRPESATYSDPFLNPSDSGAKTTAPLEQATYSDILNPADLGAEMPQTFVDVEETGLEAFEDSEANTAGSDIRKEVAELAQAGAGAAEIANRLGTDVATILSVSSGIIGDGILRSGALFVDTMAAATAFMGAKGPAEILAGNAETIRDFSDFLFTKGERGEGFFGETLPKNPVIDPDGILSDYFKSAAPEGGYIFPTSVAQRQELSDEEEAARAAYEEEQQAKTIAALGGSVIGAPYISPDEGEYDRLSNLLQGRAGPIPVAPGAISVADTTSNLPFATGEMYEAPIAAPDPTVATSQNLSAIQRPTPPTSVLQAPSAVPTSASDAELFDDLQGIRAAEEAEIKRQERQDDIYKFLADPGYARGIADSLDDANLVGNENYRKRILEGGLGAHKEFFFPEGSSGQEVARKDVNLRALQFLQGDQFTPPREIYSDLYGGDARATAKYQEEPLSVIDQISDRLYREAQQGELAKAAQTYDDYDAEAQAQRDAEIAGQRNMLEQAALARAGERLKDQQPTKDLTGMAGALQKGLDYVGKPTLDFIEGATTKFGDLVESGQQKVGDYFDAKRAMKSDEANLGAGNQIIDPNQTAKAREDERAAIQKAAQDRVDAEQAKAAKATKAAAAQAGSLEARISDAIAKREKRAEQDKWLSLAYAGAVLAEGRPNSLEKAATAGLGYFQKSRAQQDKFDADMLGLQQRIDAYKARIAAAGSKPSSMSAAGLNALQKSASDAAALAIDNPTKANMDYAEYTQALYNQAAALFATQQGIIVPPMYSGRNAQNVAD